MRRSLFYRGFVCFLCISLLLLMDGFHRMSAEAKDKAIPVGEMISKGEVKFEVKQNVWKEVEPSHFPIFQGTKVKTDKGMAVISLANDTQIDVDQQSLLSVDQMDRLSLFKGRIAFRIPPSGDLSFKVGNLSVIKSRPLQTSKTPLPISVRSEDRVGSISLNKNGSVTVKMIEGSLAILNQDRVVLAALSSRESLTIPSIISSGKGNIMVAQAGGQPGSDAEKKEGGTIEWLGLSAWAWAAIGIGLAGVTGVSLGLSQGGSGAGDGVPLCR